jgi:hypothetical protein
LEWKELRVERDHNDRLRIDDPSALQRVRDASDGELALKEPLKALGLVQSIESGLGEIPKLANLRIDRPAARREP